MRFFSLVLPDFLMSVVATSLDAKSDSQVQWKQTVYSISSNRSITKLEIKSSECGARRASKNLKWQLKMRSHPLFVRQNPCAAQSCACE
jgi:hypothetical protein